MRKLFYFNFFISITFRHANILTPYSKAVPAIIAKASTIYNPFIYAIIHNKYRYMVAISATAFVVCHHCALEVRPSLFHLIRMTLAEKFPCLRFLSPTARKDCTSSSISESSFRDSIISRQSTASRSHFITTSPRMVMF